MIRLLKIFLLASLLLGSCNSSENKVQNKELKEITIEYVDLSTLTIARVSCDSYSTSFKTLIKRLVIPEHEENYGQIYRLADSLKSFDKQALDIRVKILFTDKKSKPICMDAFGNFTFPGSDSSFRNKELHELITGLIEQPATSGSSE